MGHRTSSPTMASTPQHHPSTTASSSLAQPVDFKANGQVSRMRSHKGNMPSLPQTKYCSLCPAKFTRTTHLNRHLRSHTNERLHRCNTCKSQFTRSDLLTRHKRTCGDHLNTNRSRRKSCQACAESKIKCDLQFPCSKCSSRGRQCIFINNPVISRNKRSQKAAISSTSSTSLSSSSDMPTPNTTSPESLPSPLYPSHSSLDPFLSLTSDAQFGDFGTSSSNMVPQRPTLDFTSFDFSGSSGSSSASSSDASPRSDIFEPQRGCLLYSTDMGLDADALNTQLDAMLSTNMFEPFHEQLLPTCTQDPQATSPSTSLGDFTWVDNLPTELCTSDTFGFPETFMSPLFESPTALDHSSDLFLPMEMDLGATVVPQPSAISYGGPPVPELQHYLYLFFSEFSTQMPLIHASTWQLDNKPSFLLRIMQACGALFVKTSAAAAFIADTLSSTREFLNQEIARNPSNVTQQIHLILAAVLLQTIGIFYQQCNYQVFSDVSREIFVALIRQSGLICQINSWNPPNVHEPALLDSAWQDWAGHETLKRALLLLYLHDCHQCMQMSLPSSFHPSEFSINLPCDDALWTAGSALEWFDVLQGPSAYGNSQSRLLGVGMQQALMSLGQTRIPSLPFSLNPFASFVLIHSILRKLHNSRTMHQCPDNYSSRPKTLLDDMNAVMSGSQDNMFAAQYALYNWLQAWLNGPELTAFETGWDKPPFVCNALPFYWLSQISRMALHEGTHPATGRGTELRFHLLKHWLEQVRGFMRRREKIPSHLWDELLNIRLQISLEPDSGSSDKDGLLAFLPL